MSLDLFLYVRNSRFSSSNESLVHPNQAMVFLSVNCHPSTSLHLFTALALDPSDFFGISKRKNDNFFVPTQMSCEQMFPLINGITNNSFPMDC